MSDEFSDEEGWQFLREQEDAARSEQTAANVFKPPGAPPRSAMFTPALRSPFSANPFQVPTASTLPARPFASVDLQPKRCQTPTGPSMPVAPVLPFAATPSLMASFPIRQPVPAALSDDQHGAASLDASDVSATPSVLACLPTGPPVPASGVLSSSGA